MADLFARLLDWLAATGPFTAASYFPVFVLLNLVGVPATLLASVAGFFLSPSIAIPLALVARSLAAMMSWFAGRRLLGRRVRAALKRRPRLEALDRALAEGGLRAVILLRLAPTIPSAVTSFGLGFTRVRPGPLFLGTLLGTIPNTIIAVLIGESLDDLRNLDQARDDWSLWLRLLLALGLFALLVLARSLIRRARADTARTELP